MKNNGILFVTLTTLINFTRRIRCIQFSIVNDIQIIMTVYLYSNYIYSNFVINHQIKYPYNHQFIPSKNEINFIQNEQGIGWVNDSFLNVV